MKKDIKIMIKNDIIFNKDLSKQAILTYVGLAICLKPGIDFIYTDKNMIYSYLSGVTTAIPRRFDENLRVGLKELIDKQIVTCEKKNAGSYFLNIDNFIVRENDTYVCIYLSEIRKIITSSFQGKANLLYFYLCLLSTFIIKNKIRDTREPDKYNKKLGMVSQEYISSITNMSTSAIVEYVKVLEQLKILYVSRCSFMFRDNNGGIKRHNNIYGRYADRELIDEFTKVRYSMYDDLHKVKSTSITNNARSLMQKYNCLCRGIQYDKETIAAIYDYISDYNEKYPKKCRDMNVFSKYGYNIN